MSKSIKRKASDRGRSQFKFVSFSIIFCSDYQFILKIDSSEDYMANLSALIP